MHVLTKVTLPFLVFYFCVLVISAHALVRPIVFPVQGEYSFHDDYANPRGGGMRKHLGNDIIAPKHTPVVSTVDGVITFIAIPQASWGYAITIEDSDGYKYHYIHLNNDTPGTDDGNGGEQYAYVPGLHRGSKVTKGQLLGWLGDSGNAEETVSHLHFEIQAPGSEYPNPFESLMAASGNKTQGAFAAVTHADVDANSGQAVFIATRPLREGMIDADVALLHTQLTKLGFYSGTTSETFTSVTREAVRQFQVREKINSTGVADEETRNRIALRMQIVGASTAVPSSLDLNLALGARGESVVQLQKRLKELGYFTDEATGIYGPLTRAAVIAFQKASSLETVGSVGPKTRAALLVAVVPEKSVVASRTLTVGMRGVDVTEVQNALQKQGYLQTQSTGYFGTQTKAAVLAFQKAEGIEMLGIVGPLTRARLLY